MLTNTNLQDIDFNSLYGRQKEASTFKPKLADDWNKKADDMNSRVKKSNYNQDFFNLVNLEGCKTLIDAGCGVGNLSLEFAPHLEKIHAFDYSDRMLELTKENAKEQGISNIDIYKQDIEEPWDLPKADIVIASRSVGVVELEKLLKKINNHAKKRVYLTMMTGGSFVSEAILEVLDSDIIPKPDYIYLINILHSFGIYASINFIETVSRQGTFQTEESFIKAIKWSIGELSEQDSKNLSAYFKALPENEKGEKESPSPTTWAVISWEKTKEL